ncbi:hypothetical protein F511_42530 [Dorcoceras hygrometricum]|uniref:Dystroglycan-like n=1 Tax=Dorcoceras hygrometricum TaxID=472368 RepID=A0A2Z7AHJ3_9LAMI|nr:hypothetical protein F511_42530 [Dorcoceras hygrometricum]
MAASFYSNSVHVDFESSLAMGEPGMVSMFQALIASGLQGFLGCPTVVYEESLVEFFANGTVRNGLVVSTVNGVAVEISEKLFAETFDLPVDGLADISEMPKDKIFDARSIVSLTGEPVTLSGLKSQMKMHYRLLCDIMAKSISVKAGSFNAITVEKFSLFTAVFCDVQMNWGRVLFGFLKKMVTPGTKRAKGFAIQISLLLESVPNLELGASSEFPSSKILTDKTIHRYIAVIDKSGAQEPADAPKVKKAPKTKVASRKRPADIPSVVPVVKKERTSKKKSTLEIVVVAQEAIPIQSVPVSPTIEPMLVDSVNEEEMQDENVQSAEAKIDKDEAMSLDDLILSIPADIPLPSVSIEITKIKMGTQIKIPGVDEKLCYLASLPQITADDKGKALLVEKDPVKGHPAREHYFSICANIDLLVKLREQIIEEVDRLFHSFSFKKLASINVEEMSKKEDLALYWGETESIHEALSRKRYILLKYREMLVRKFLQSWKKNFKPGEGTSATDLQVIDMLWERHLDVLQEFSKQKITHGLLWDRPCCSTIFEGSPRDRGVVIARTNTNTSSRCWIRTMIYVNGVWTVEPCADRWVNIPQMVFSNEVPRQRQYVDTLPTTSKFFRLMTKRWADICFEVVDFCASRSLLPVGSLQFCRSLPLVEPVFRVSPSQSSVFAFRVSQFCSVFVDFSVFSCLPTTNITVFLSSIARERTVLRNVQRSVSVVHPNVQFLDQHISSPNSSEDSSMNFENTDIDDTATAPAFFLPGSTTVSLDITKALNQLQASLNKISNRDDGAALNDTILMHLHDIEKKFTARFDAQDRWIGALRNDSNDQRNLLSLEFNSSHKKLHTQIAAASIDQIDMQRKMTELNAKVDAIAMNLERVKRDAEATKEAILHQLFEFQSQAQENHIILTTQLGQLIEDLNRGGNDKKGEGVSSRGPQPTRAHVPVRVERRPLPTREPSPDAQSSGQYLSAEQAAEFVSFLSSSIFESSAVDIQLYLRLGHHLATGILQLVPCDWYFATAGYKRKEHLLNLSTKSKRCRINLFKRHRFVIALFKSCASYQLLILDFFESSMLTSSLMLAASSSCHADVIIAESRYLVTSIQQLISSFFALLIPDFYCSSSSSTFLQQTS